MQLRWLLCDLLGRVLAPPLRDRTEGSVIIPLNERRTASVKLSLDELPAASLVYPLTRVLKVLYGPHCVFAGPIMTPAFDKADGMVEIVAFDPSWYLELAFLEPPPLPKSKYKLRLLNTDQSQILWQLVQAARPTTAELTAGVLDLPIIQGSLPATRLRTREYEPGAQVWEEMLKMPAVENGVDFELEPLHRADGVLARLNTFERQGSDRAEQAVFHAGWGMDNCENFRWLPDGALAVNRAIAQGQSEEGKKSPYYISDQLESQQQLGLLRWYAGQSDASSVLQLSELARGHASARAFPINFFEVIPAVEGLGAIDEKTGRRARTNTQTGGAYGVPPVCAPDGDYWLGDTIQTHAQMDSAGRFRVELPGRVTEIELSDDDAGQGDARVALKCAPELPLYPVT